jgi:hypothetical protein
MNHTEHILESIDEKFSDVELLMLELPIKAAVKSQLVGRLYAIYEEMEDALVMTPVDFE